MFVGYILNNGIKLYYQTIMVGFEAFILDKNDATTFTKDDAELYLKYHSFHYIEEIWKEYHCVAY